MADLPVEFADLRLSGLVFAIWAGLEHARGTVEQRLLPGVDLAGVDAEFAGQFADCTVALDGGQGYFRLEGSAVLLTGLLHVLLLGFGWL